MDYLVVVSIVVGCVVLLFLIARRFRSKTLPKKTEQLFNDLGELERLGFEFKGDRYAGIYRGFYISVFVTSNMRGSDQVMVMVATDTQSGPIDFLNGFFSGYFVNGESGGCTYVGFRLFMRTLLDPAEGVQHKLDKLIDKFGVHNVKPFQLQG